MTEHARRTTQQVERQIRRCRRAAHLRPDGVRRLACHRPKCRARRAGPHKCTRLRAVCKGKDEPHRGSERFRCTAVMARWGRYVPSRESTAPRLFLVPNERDSTSPSLWFSFGVVTARMPFPWTTSQAMPQPSTWAGRPRLRFRPPAMRGRRGLSRSRANCAFTLASYGGGPRGECRQRTLAVLLAVAELANVLVAVDVEDDVLAVEALALGRADPHRGNAGISSPRHPIHYECSSARACECLEWKHQCGLAMGPMCVAYKPRTRTSNNKVGLCCVVVKAIHARLLSE